ncbi:MAG: putative metal-dependent hydrolase [Planctomycetota bacterium]|jgi:predicted metal-dependent hydrolase
MSPLPYIAGYPAELQAQAETLLKAGELGPMLAQRYPEEHGVRSSKELSSYVQELKSRHMQKAAPLGKVTYDNSLHSAHNALGLHVTRQRVQGSKLRKRREMRIASLFKDAPADFLRMIVVHELAHMKFSDHDKGFYKLCTYMEPDYHQLEFDLRLYLLASEQSK